MAKTVTVDGTQVESIKIEVSEGKVSGLKIFTEVSYGTFGRHEVLDLWAKLTVGQKTTLQGIVDKALNAVQTEYLG